MGEGMASYCGRDLREGTEDASDYNGAKELAEHWPLPEMCCNCSCPPLTTISPSPLRFVEYCFIVAGLVGEGLTRLWVAHGEESADLSGREMPLAHQMGLFLQKTNIIR